MSDAGHPRPGPPGAVKPDSVGRSGSSTLPVIRQTGTDPSAQPTVPTSSGNSSAAAGAAPPTTGDLVIDGALAELAAVAPDDLDTLLRAGAIVEDVLRGRLRDLSS